MTVTNEESKKLIGKAQEYMDELRDESTPIEKKQMLAKQIGDLLRWATNIDVKVDPNSGAMSGKFIPSHEKKVTLG